MSKKQLLIGGVGVVPGSLRNAGPAMADICTELEPLLVENNFMRGAPFETISLIVRFGTQTNLSPEYSAIDVRHRELPVAFEFSMEHVRKARKEQLKHALLLATLETLINIGRRYGLPTEGIKQRMLEVERGGNGDARALK